jgi:glycosyltransferase involved in cell wall biosynthesis
MLKTLFIHRDLPFHGGVPRTILNLAKSCDLGRIHMHVASFVAPSSEMQSAFGELGIAPRQLGDKGYIRPARRLRQWVRQERIDVIVANSFKSYLVAKMACAASRCRVIPWVHSIPLVLDGALRRRLFHWLSKNDTMVFSSNAIRNVHRSPDHDGKSAVVYYGVDDPCASESSRPYERSMRRKLGVPDEALVLCYIAEFIGWKDHATLLRAMDRLDERLNAHLLLIGTGQLLEQTRQQAKSLQCAPRIHFLGPRMDARKILGVSDLYVHPSRGEGFGLAVVEAMLAGRPVIASRDGAFIEYVDDGNNGVLFTAGDDQDLAARITELADDRLLGKQLGQQARMFALQTFSPRQFAESTCRVIESAVMTDQGKVA